MKREKGHKTRLGWKRFQRSICDQPKCRFYKKEAQQGHCFSVLNKTQDQYIREVEKSSLECLKGIKSLRKRNKLESDKAWIKHLESYFVCHWMNETFTLDELVYLRAQNAVLKNKLRKSKGR